jgi:hypothetical protein
LKLSSFPERIWAWTYNLPANRKHGERSWVDFPPVFKPWVIVDWPGWKFWVSQKQEYHQEAIEYVRIDVYQELMQKYDAEKAYGFHQNHGRAS